jgi:hypothetical protein
MLRNPTEQMLLAIDRIDPAFHRRSSMFEMSETTRDIASNRLTSLRDRQIDSTVAWLLNTPYTLTWI